MKERKMAKDASGVNRIKNGAVLPTGGGNVKIELQGFTRGSYGSETMEDRLMQSPPQNEELL
jgi:hypothetical protein